MCETCLCEAILSSVAAERGAPETTPTPVADKNVYARLALATTPRTTRKVKVVMVTFLFYLVFMNIQHRHALIASLSAPGLPWLQPTDWCDGE